MSKQAWSYFIVFHKTVFRDRNKEKFARALFLGKGPRNTRNSEHLGFLVGILGNDELRMGAWKGTHSLLIAQKVFVDVPDVWGGLGGSGLLKNEGSFQNFES